LEFSTDWFSHNIKHWNEHLAHLKDEPAQALEIGSYEGRSCCWMLKNILTDEQSTITCVDVWTKPEIEKQFDCNVVESGQSHKVKKIKSASCIALRQLRFSSFDFIYIDGSHEGRDVLEDAVLSFRLLKNSGILIFDDYLWEGKAKIFPKPAIDSFLHLYQHQIKVLFSGWQIIIQKHT
jgi:predicted O-methyltransferase YrrM